VVREVFEFFLAPVRKLGADRCAGVADVDLSPLELLEADAGVVQPDARVERWRPLLAAGLEAVQARPVVGPAPARNVRREAIDRSASDRLGAIE